MSQGSANGLPGAEKRPAHQSWGSAHGKCHCGPDVLEYSGAARGDRTGEPSAPRFRVIALSLANETNEFYPRSSTRSAAAAPQSVCCVEERLVARAQDQTYSALYTAPSLHLRYDQHTLLAFRQYGEGRREEDQEGEEGKEGQEEP